MSNPKISVGNNYKLIKKIGKGSFGEVYLATDRDGEEYACKIENNGSKNRLKSESLIYKRCSIKKLVCVPTVYKYIETPEYNLLIMQLLGKSLNCIFEDCGGQIDIGTVMKIGVNIIDHLEKIHRIGIIHRDIKPNNFMFGIDEHSSDLYVMDFGLSKKWYTGGDHIEFKVGRSMIGTARYASLNIHNGTEPSRRDDLESVGYMLVYLNKGSLPWQGLKKKTKENPIDKIWDKKMMVSLKSLCVGMPECFYEYINYTRNLQFNEKPDYDYLRNLLITSAKKNNIHLKYFWENDDCTPPDNNGGNNNYKNENHKNENHENGCDTNTRIPQTVCVKSTETNKNLVVAKDIGTARDITNNSKKQGLQMETNKHSDQKSKSNLIIKKRTVDRVRDKKNTRATDTHHEIPGTVTHHEIPGTVTHHEIPGTVTHHEIPGIVTQHKKNESSLDENINTKTTNVIIVNTAKTVTKQPQKKKSIRSSKHKLMISSTEQIPQ